MLDKLTLTSSESVSLEKAQYGLAGRYATIKVTATKYHRLVYCFCRLSNGIAEQLLTLHINPASPWISPTKIELNPSKFANFDSLAAMLSNVVTIGSTRITRLDHTVDIEPSLRIIHESLIFSRKKFREIYGAGHSLTGFYVGKHPEVLCVYEKKIGNETLTRIELRQHGEKAPIRRFVELPQLTNFRPFDRLEFKSVKPQCSLRESSKAALLRELVGKVGAQGAYKLLNRNSNFKRDFRGVLERPAEIPDLNDLYQKNLKSFFGEQHGYRKAN